MLFNLVIQHHQRGNNRLSSNKVRETDIFLIFFLHLLSAKWMPFPISGLLFLTRIIDAVARIGYFFFQKLMNFILFGLPVPPGGQLPAALPHNQQGIRQTQILLIKSYLFIFQKLINQFFSYPVQSYPPQGPPQLQGKPDEQ